MPSKRRLKDKYAGSSRERICCLNSVWLVIDQPEYRRWMKNGCRSSVHFPLKQASHWVLLWPRRPLPAFECLWNETKKRRWCTKGCLISIKLGRISEKVRKLEKQTVAFYLPGLSIWHKNCNVLLHGMSSHFVDFCWDLKNERIHFEFPKFKN